MIDAFKEFNRYMAYFPLGSCVWQPASSAGALSGSFERIPFCAPTRRIHQPALQESLFPLRHRFELLAGEALIKPGLAAHTTLVICHDFDFWKKWQPAPHRYT